MSNGHDDHLPEALYAPHWRYRPELKGLSGIYLNTALRNLAFGLINLFIPIYIYKITNQIETVFAFSVIEQTAIVSFSFPIAQLISRIGPDLSMLFSNLLRSIFWILLILAKSNYKLLWPAAILAGIMIPLFWLPYHSAFASVCSKKKLPRQLATVSNIARLSGVFAPFLGGVIADKLGFGALFPTGIFLIIASSLPIFLDEYNRKEKLLPLGTIEKNLFSSERKDLFLSFFFQGFRDTVGVIVWPLFLYTILGNFERIGGLATFTLIVSLIFVNFLAKKLKKLGLIPIVSGAMTESFIWLLRGLTLNPFLIILSDPLGSLATISFNLPLENLFYKSGAKNPLSFFTARELALHGGLLTSCLLIFLGLKLGLSWQGMAFLAIIGVNLMMVFLVKFMENKNHG